MYVLTAKLEVKPLFQYLCGNRFVIHTRSRNQCSSLKYGLYRKHIIDYKSCESGVSTENDEHYLLFCKIYNVQRQKLLDHLNLLFVPIT